MFGFGFSPFGEMSYYMLIWMSLLQVYASMSPIVHIVNIGSAATESRANITVLSTKLFQFGSLLVILFEFCVPPCIWILHNGYFVIWLHCVSTFFTLFILLT